MNSILTKSQTRTYGPKPISGWGSGAQIKAEVRFDDDCNNGHNSFAITGEIFILGRGDCEACGCLHDEIRKHFPELAPYIKWHLSDTTGPMHYTANTLYWLGYQNAPAADLEHARNTAVWPDMPEDMLATSGKYTRAQVAAILIDRRDDLLVDFRKAVEELGFVW